MANSALLQTITPEYKALVDKVATMINQISGNKFGEKQASMIESRLKKRMMELGIKTPDEYLRFIVQNAGTETEALVSLLTTHHTFFFREFDHFEYLQKALPAIIAACKARGENTIHIWSAACSRGHEAYSIAMFLEYHLPLMDSSMTYKILGTDIDNESIKVAINGVYHYNELKEIPMNFLGDHWSKGTGEIFLYSKAKKSIRSKCDFRNGNLLQVKATTKGQEFDIIFCRNVFIYFEQSVVRDISLEILKTLKPHGLFITGVSESLMGHNVPVTSVASSVYIHGDGELTKTVVAPISKPKTDLKIPVPSVLSQKNITPTLTAPVTSTLLKVLCVDDSPSILTMMKKILNPTNGFEVVATAPNGVEAMKQLKLHKVDLMTLDIHMPEMDGLTYLKTHFHQNHPKVIIVSSTSRDDSDIAVKALKLGASDYVEKPSLQNLEECGDEIRTKLRALASTPAKYPPSSSMDKDFQTRMIVDKPESKLRLIFATLSDMPKIAKFMKECIFNQPPTVVLFEGYDEILEALVIEYSKGINQKVIYLNNGMIELEPNKIYFADAKKMTSSLMHGFSKRPTSILCYGATSYWASNAITNWKAGQILLEDCGPEANKKNPLWKKAHDIVPASSYAYMSNRFFSIK